MKGDSENHEDAFLIFRIFADTIAEEKKTSKKSKPVKKAE